METGLIGYVGSDCVMTVKAQSLLRLLVKLLVTRRAFRFQISMIADNLAWHYQRLNILSV